MKRIPLLDLLASRYPDYSREQILAYILAGEVSVNGERVREARRKVSLDADISFSADRYVSRGGLKLEHALTAWAVPVRDRVFIDAGASTGGFTDCLLQHGARCVHAVDVGHNQIAYSLRQDERVLVHERTNVMHLVPADIDPPAHASVGDLSFRSAVGAAKHLLDISSEQWMIALVKPQFEIASPDPGFDGVVRDPTLLRQTVEEVAGRLIRQGVEVRGAVTSPIRGRRGNTEYLFFLTAQTDAPSPFWPSPLRVEQVVTTLFA
ncbi:MAG: TlyA family rRNA (cytidine-2'-O)-methyltransferase [Spirochaetes bacterium]|nr:TlyA family rRNA (cytidine-2'-O)-methyltransferase [Spirochaetota bacterium]